MQPTSFVTLPGNPLFGLPQGCIPEARNSMNKDRISGSAKQAKGAIELAADKVLGDAKLVADGKKDKVGGKVQNVVGRVNDVLKK
jgi:uncharacterized protein YjbJ (UPF0337 family)